MTSHIDCSVTPVSSQLAILDRSLTMRRARKMEVVQASMSAIAAVLTVIHCGSAAISAWRQRSRRKAVGPSPHARISIVRPLKGMDPWTEACLESTFRLSWTNLEIVFCVASDDDPVVPLVSRIIERFPETGATLLVGNCRMSNNPKLNNMAKAWGKVDGDWIVFVDANVNLPADAVERLLAKDGPGVGLVSSPPRAVAPIGAAAVVECAILNSYQGRWQTLADSIGYGFAQGKVLAFKRHVLERSSGLSMLGHEPAEDAAATKLVRSIGLHVRLVDSFFDQPVGRRTWQEIWQRQARWASLRRATFPWQYSTEVLSFPWLAAAFVALSADTLVSSATVAALLLFAWYAAEAVCSAIAGWPERTRDRILRDFIMPAVWLRGWLFADFEWHGHKMRAESIIVSAESRHAVRPLQDAPR